MSKHNFLPLYKELEDREGIQTLFRKFDTATWIVQYNEKGEQIGQVCVSAENMQLIQDAPSIKVGDGKTIQKLKGELS